MVRFPKISIIIPSLNQGQYIGKTIESILTQNYPNLELLVIDGGSNDNTLDILTKYSNHFKFWVSEPDKGQSDAINKGLNYVTGDIVNWINSDDLLVPDSLFRIAETYRETNADILCGYCEYFYENTVKSNLIHRTFLCNSPHETLFRGEINQPSMFYKSSILKELKGVNSNLQCVMDLDLFYKYLIRYGQSKIFLSDNTYSKFRIHDASKTSSLEDKFIKERSILENSMIELAPIPKDLKAYLMDGNSLSENYTLEKKYFSINKYMISIYEKKYFEIYQKEYYEAIPYLYKKLLVGGKNVFSKNHLGVLYNSLRN